MPPTTTPPHEQHARRDEEERERYTDVPVRAVERLEPALAGDEDAAALETEIGAPPMRVERVGYAASGRPVELSHDLFRGDWVRVVWTTELP